MTLPFVVREVVPVLREFGVDQEEVAYTLGAGRWRTFWRVTLPSIRWGLAYGVTLTVARSLGEFGALLVVSGNILGRTQTATLYVHDGVESFQPEGAYAASVVLAGVSFVHAGRHGDACASAWPRARAGRNLDFVGWARPTIAFDYEERRMSQRGHRGAEPVASGSARSRPWTTCPSRCPPGSSWRCSDRPGRARARSCGSSPGWSRPTAATSS